MALGEAGTSSLMLMTTLGNRRDALLLRDEETEAQCWGNQDLNFVLSVSKACIAAGSLSCGARGDVNQQSLVSSAVPGAV